MLARNHKELLVSDKLTVTTLCTSDNGDSFQNSENSVYLEHSLFRFLLLSIKTSALI